MPTTIWASLTGTGFSGCPQINGIDMPLQHYPDGGGPCPGSYATDGSGYWYGSVPAEVSGYFSLAFWCDPSCGWQITGICSALPACGTLISGAVTVESCYPFEATVTSAPLGGCCGAGGGGSITLLGG